MPKVPLNLTSQAIINASYDDETQELDLTFYGNRTYSLHNVPQTIVEELQNAPSAGSYFRDRLKGRY